MTYVSLRPAGRFVRGPLRSALYDLRDKRIYPVDPWVTCLLERALEGEPLERALARVGVRGRRAQALVREALGSHPLLDLSGRRRPRPAPAPASGESCSGAAPLVGPDSRLAMASAAPRRRGLDFLWLELTERCNLNCVHCYAGSGPGLKDGPLGTDDYRRLLREARAGGCRSVQFTGGEATLHAGFWLLVDEARALGYERIEVYTNATLLSPERIAMLRQRGVRVAVSFYSHRREVHEAITRVPGSFERTLQAIRGLTAAGVPLRVGLIRMRANQDDIPSAIELLLSAGVQREAIRVDTVRPAGRGCGDSLAPAEPAAPAGAPTAHGPMAGASIEVRADGSLGCETCWSGKLCVAPSGDAYPCIFSRELPSGNVLASPLSAVVEGEALQDLWSIDKAQIPVCRDCEFRYGCFDCRALAYKQSGRIRSKPPSCSYDPYTGEWGSAAGVPAPLPAEAGVPRRGGNVRWVVAGDLGLIYAASRRSLVAVNRSAAEVLRLCDGRRSLAGIASVLARRYRVPRPRAADDVRRLAADLVGLGVLEVRAA
jgi:radical SAM protein with 4Fe4S-binding SPASM domain